MVTDGTKAALLDAVRSAFEAGGATVELIAPKIGGAKVGRKLVPADHAISGAPSVLFDAVVLLPSADGAADLAERKAAQDFVSDAFAHCKFIGYVADAQPLLAAAGVADRLDAGCVELTTDGAEAFLELCGGLRHWDRAVQP